MTYDASLYRLVHRGNPGDETFYERACREADSVLELGCGWGRVLRRLNVPGRRLTGVERNPSLLAMAREELPEHVTLFEADMISFHAGGSFQRVLAPHGGLWALEDDDEVMECFRRVREHLEPGGLFVFDTASPDGFHDTAVAAELDDQIDHVVTVGSPDGRTFDVYERIHWEPEAQRLLVSYVYVARDGGPDMEGTVLHRYLLRPQVEQLLVRSGLEVVAIHGGFAGQPWTPRAEHIVVTARRPLSH